MNNNENKRPNNPPRRGPHGMGPGEKPKNLGLTLKKLAHDIKRFLPIIIIAIVLSIVSSVFSIIGPDKLSDLTDELSKGLVLNRDNLTEITNDISSSFTKEHMQLVIPKIMNDQNISLDDKQKLMGTMQNMNANSQEEMVKMLVSMPHSIQSYLLSDSNIKGVKITTSEKIKFLDKMKGVTKDSSAKDIYKAIDHLPKSISNLIKPKINFDAVKTIVVFLFTIYLLSALLSSLFFIFCAFLLSSK